MTGERVTLVLPLMYGSVGDIPVDGSLRGRDIVRCCEALEAFYDDCLRRRCHEGVDDE